MGTVRCLGNYGCAACASITAIVSHIPPTCTFSPLARLLTECTAPELLFLETKFASPMSYGLTVDFLQEVLPLGKSINAATVRNNVHAVGQRIDKALGMEENLYQVMFRGEMAKGASPKQVKERLKTLLRCEEIAIARLFSGHPMTVKSGIDLQTARQYQDIFEKTGALCRDD